MIIVISLKECKILIMTTSILHQKGFPDIRETIAPEFQFLFRNKFYVDFFEEVVTKTLEQIEKEQTKNLTEFEKAIYEK